MAKVKKKKPKKQKIRVFSGMARSTSSRRSSGMITKSLRRTAESFSSSSRMNSGLPATT